VFLFVALDLCSYIYVIDILVNSSVDGKKASLSQNLLFWPAVTV
jgi:hypothetical protein